MLSALACSSGQDFVASQQKLRAHLHRILALPTERVALESKRSPDGETDSYTREKLRFVAETGEEVPGFLLLPKEGIGPFPTMICLQGHTSGMHLSLGIAHDEKDAKYLTGGRDIALQAVANGWAALLIEQRAFGVRAEDNVRCHDAALRALLRGRPLTGMRVFDVMRALDFIAEQPDLDTSRVGCLGNSTGGTVSFYAACADERLALAVVSCSFCTFADSWLSRPHCACGYLPGIAQVADMPEWAGLIAPRRLLVVAGKNDELASIEGVRQGFAQAKELFGLSGQGQRVQLVEGEGGHQFFRELAWPAIRDLMKL